MIKLVTAWVIACIVSLGLLASAATAQAWPKDAPLGWDALLAAAQQEAPLVVMGSPEHGDELVAGFEQDTGLSVLFIGGSRDEGRTRFLREVQAGVPSIDVFLSSAVSLSLAKKGLLAPIRDMLILPEVTDPSNWQGGALAYVDTDGVFLPNPTRYSSGRILVNTNVVDPARLKTWDDLLSEEYRGKIIFQDPANPGAGDNVATYLAFNKSTEFLNSLLRDQEITYTRDYRQVADSVAHGSHGIGLGAIPVHILRYQNEGLDFLKVLTMEDLPGYLVGGGSVIAIPKLAPSPNSAAVFANWYLSQHGQEALTQASLVPSSRVDVVDGNWPDFLEPDWSIDYHDMYSEKWITELEGKMREATAAALAK